MKMYSIKFLLVTVRYLTKSTKKTFHNKRKATPTKMSDKYMLNQAMNLLESKRERKPLGADKLFEKSIGESLKKKNSWYTMQGVC